MGFDFINLIARPPTKDKWHPGNGAGNDLNAGMSNRVPVVPFPAKRVITIGCFNTAPAGHAHMDNAGGGAGLGQHIFFYCGNKIHRFMQSAESWAWPRPGLLD